MSVGPIMVNDSLLGALSHWWRIYGRKFRTKRLVEPDPNDIDGEPCQLVPIWLMILPSEHFHTCGVFMVAKFRKKDAQNLTLMT